LWYKEKLLLCARKYEVLFSGVTGQGNSWNWRFQYKGFRNSPTGCWTYMILN